MKVKVITYTPEPESVVAAAARLCYSNSNIDSIMERQTPEKIKEMIEKLMSMGHESPLEHVSFTFGIEGVSRSLLAQITRHRIASYSVQSQRYVDMENFLPVVPFDIENNDMAYNSFKIAMIYANAYYKNIVEELEKQYVENNGLEQSVAHKKAIENARSVLPNACPTNLIVTMNARSLLNFFKHRCCNRAQDEIRELANEMLALCKNIAPNIFAKAGASCVSSKCPEGKMSCGKQITKNISTDKDIVRKTVRRIDKTWNNENVFVSDDLRRPTCKYVENNKIENCGRTTSDK